MQKNRKQEKEVGINPDFDDAEAGNAHCHACGTAEVKKKAVMPESQRKEEKRDMTHRV